MAICKRNNCTLSIGELPDERKFRLCSVHYQGKLSNAAKRAQRWNLTCQYPPCGISLSGTRNQRYCCIGHRNKDRRLIDDDAIVSLVKHSYWINVESKLKNNPLGLGSITSPDDIADLIRLYQRKADYQKAYNTLNGQRVIDSQGQVIKRLIPWLELELCHIYPNSKGGANTADNIIIAPALINRMMKDTIPVSKTRGTFSGIKAAGSPLPVKSTLLKALTMQYRQDEIQEALASVKHVTFADLSVPRRLFGTDIYAYPPLLKLLNDQAMRLGLWRLRESINSIESSHWLSAGPANELFAAAAFHAMLNGDKDDLIEVFSSLHEDITERARNKEKLNHDYYQNILERYVSRYFQIDLHNQESCILFYNSFFTVPPLDKHGVLIIPHHF
ncbi:hypothetical protein [Enterobacter hormaechei]|nr:hypothetical protein [Enterobacter hormaechei]MDO2406335.1 hypothetical protein [Enterobacter hormaechei]